MGVGRENEEKFTAFFCYYVANYEKMAITARIKGIKQGNIAVISSALVAVIWYNYP